MNASVKFTIGNWIDPLPTMALDGVGGYNGRQVLQSRPPLWNRTPGEMEKGAQGL